MKPPGATAQTLNRTPGPDWDTNPREHRTATPSIHPDVAAYCEAAGITRPRDIAMMQARYDKAMAREAFAQEFAAAVVTMKLGRRGSVPVDRAVGEFVANQKEAA